MKIKDFIRYLKEYDGELNLELAKVIAVPMPDDPKEEPGSPLMLRLDFPIIGVAQKDQDVLLVIEAAAEMIAFGKDITRLDGSPLTKEDIDAVKRKQS